MRNNSDSADFLKIAGVVLVLLWTLGADCAWCDEKAAEQPNVGELKIEGKFIKLLVLDSREGDHRKIKEPGESVKLPADEYMVQEVHLEGEYICHSWQIPGRDWFTVRADKPAILKLGGPLKQKMTVGRKGSLLTLSHELLGIGGEKYSDNTGSRPPRFAVYRGDKRIGDGAFEYG